MDIFEQLRRDEGVRRTLYRDEFGTPTIGVGHNLTTPISDAVIDLLLHDDVHAADVALRTHLPWVSSLSEVRYGVLLNMTFNLGIGGVAGFSRMLAHIQAGDWTEAARDLLDSHYARQVGPRAERLARQLQSDEWQ